MPLVLVLVFSALTIALGSLCLTSASALASEAPVIESESVSNLSSTDATLEANINPGIAATHYQLRLEYGCGISGEACAQFCKVPGPCPGPVNGPVDIPLPGGDLPASSEVEHISLDLHEVGVALQPATKYRYSIEATNTAGTVKGPGQIFTTPAGEPLPPAGAEPRVNGVSVSNVTRHDATLEAEIDPNGLPTTYEFRLGRGCYPEVCWAIVAIPLPAEILSSSEGEQSVSLDLNSVGVSLQPNSQYYYSLVATNGDGQAQGNDGTFRTPPSEFAPSVSSLEPESGPTTGATRVVIHGDFLEGAKSVEFGSVQGRIVEEECGGSCELAPYTTLVVEAPAQAAGTVDVTVTTGQGSSSTNPGDQFTYTAPALTPSEVVTEAAEATPGGFKLEGELNPQNSPTSYYFIYKKAGETECEDLLGCGPETALGGPLTGDTQQQVTPTEVTGLTRGATYVYWLIARSADGSVRGNEVTFTVPSSHAHPLGGEEETPPLSPAGSTSISSPDSTTAPSSTLSTTPLISALVKNAKPKILTRTQRLAKALTQCRKAKTKRKRVVCEKQAKTKYAPPVSKKRKH